MKEKQSVVGIISLVFGIIGLLTSCIIFGILPSIIGLVLGIVGLNEKDTNKSFSKSGVICSIIGIVISVLMAVIIFSSSSDKIEEALASEDSATVTADLNSEEKLEKEQAKEKEAKEEAAKEKKAKEKEAKEEAAKEKKAKEKEAKEEAAKEKKAKEKEAKEEAAKEKKAKEKENKEKEENAYKIPVSNLEEIKDIDTEITEVLVDAGYTVDQATAIHKILNTIGITSIEIQHMTGEAQKGLNSVVCYPNGKTNEDGRFFFTTEDGTLFYAGYYDSDLYDSSKGGFLKNYNDVHVPEKEVSTEIFVQLQEISEDVVKSCLNYPATAKFGMFDWGVGRSDDEYQVTGKVTAQNGFGVKDDIYFSVWFTESNNSFSLEGVSLNGVRVK